MEHRASIDTLSDFELPVGKSVFLETFIRETAKLFLLIYSIIVFDTAEIGQRKQSIDLVIQLVASSFSRQTVVYRLR